MTPQHDDRPWLADLYEFKFMQSMGATADGYHIDHIATYWANMEYHALHPEVTS
jgi:hypothetical protein